MKKRKGLTRVGLFVVIAVVIFVVLIVHLALEQVRKNAFRLICATNLKGLGTAMMVYAYDHDDKYPQLGHGPWSKTLGYSYEDSSIKAPEYKGPCTITSSLYLLVREADVSPLSFICPWSDQEEFDGFNSKSLDILELWDFGPNPHKHVSYAYHNPYGKFPADEKYPAAFAVAADMNPWFKNGNIIPSGSNNNLPQIINIMSKSTWKYANTLNHINSIIDYLKDGQNVLYIDGHVAFETESNVGINNDNIYTFWSTDENPTEQDIQGGTAPTSRSGENDAKSKDDSFLAI